MLTKVDIRSKLTSELNSTTWSSLKTSFLGRELIEYGTNLIYYNAVMSETLKRSMYPESADISGLVNLSYNLDIPIDTFSPGYIKIAIQGSRVYRPFELQMKFGSVVFTNYNYVDKNSSCFLYQGVVKSIADGSSVVDFNYSQSENMSTYKDIINETSYIEYQKLGEFVISDSVQVFKNKYSQIIPVSNWSPLISNPEADIIKIKKGYDNSTNVYWGDGGIYGWGLQKDAAAIYQILFLSATFEDFEPDSMTLSAYAANVAIETIAFTILSTEKGTQRSLERAKIMLESSVGKLTAVVTIPQITAFTRRDPAVLDCVVSPEANNTIKIYVKPVVENDTTFDYIQNNITLYGELLTKYLVEAGSPLVFSLEVVPLRELLPRQVSEITALLNATYAYLNLAFKAIISASSVTELINTNYPGAAIAEVRLEQIVEQIGTIQLQVHPQKGTISVVKAGVEIGWDSEGTIYSFSDLDHPLVGIVRKLGDFYISSIAETDVFKPDMTKYSTNPFFNIEGVKEMWVHGDSMIMVKGDGVDQMYYTYHISSVFNEGKYSLQRNFLVPVKPLAGAFHSDTLFEEHDIYIKGVGFYKLEVDTAVCVLNRYDLGGEFVAPVGNFQVSIGPDTNPTVTSFLLGDDLMVLTEAGFYRIANVANVPDEVAEEYTHSINTLFDGDLSGILFIKNSLTCSVVCRVEGTDEVLYKGPSLAVVPSLSKLIITEEYVEIYRVAQLGSFVPRTRIIEFGDKTVICDVDETGPDVYKVIDVSVPLAPVTLFTSTADYRLWLQSIGTVDYEGKTVTFESGDVAAATLSYITIDQLISADIQSYPKLNEVLWV